MLRRGGLGAILALGGLIAATFGAQAQSASPAGSSAPVDAAAARAWCESKGGVVQERRATYGTNNDQSAWVDLGRSMELCRFTAEDGSRIYVDTLTLATPTPTLAAAAYLAKVQNDLDPAKGNPATQDCTALGGTSVFGPGASGGGWVLAGDPDDEIIAMCLFADGSAIDEWGITYHAAGTIRGADLEPLFAWAGPERPHIFD
ncbi:MAG: hypothetical protein U0667_17445 [Chloroflexota bacterium]